MFGSALSARMLLPSLVAACICLPLGAGEIPPSVDRLTLAGQVEDMCTASRPNTAIACVAYLRGMYEGLVEGQISSSEERISFCPPANGLGQDEIRDAFLKYVHREPDSRSEDASLSLLIALEDDFPCAGSDGSIDPDGQDTLATLT